jgi:hypothetical protein
MSAPSNSEKSNPNTAQPERAIGMTRRTFTAAVAGAAAAASIGPAFVHADDKTGKKLPIVGTGDFTYECQHNWGELPKHIHWGDTHGIVFDETGLIYITHQAGGPPMDAIAVFEPSGKFVRSFGKEFHGGGHGLAIRKEGGEEFLYMCDVSGRNRTAKLTLKGEIVWSKDAPKESGKYEKGGYKPTNIAFHPDGGFYIGDGYGSSYIHQYDKDAKYVRTFGGHGNAPGKLSCPHGLWWDDRPGRTPALVVADRSNQRLQYFTEDGKHISFTQGLTAPCYFSIRGETLLVPDLFARVSLLDKDNKPIVHLGYDEAWVKHVQSSPAQLRNSPKEWLPGRFVHPHHAAFDKDGNIFVVEWVPIGRITKLVHVA